MTATSTLNITHALCGAISLFAFAYKLIDLRRDPENLALRGVCSARLCTALAYLCITPSCYVRIDRLLGIPNVAELLASAFIVLSALSSHLNMIGWFASPGDVRCKVIRACAAYGVALTTMLVLFFRTPLPGEHPVDFETHFAALDQAGPFVIVFLGTYGLNLANTARSAFPSSRTIGRPWLSSSLRLTALGSIFVIGYLCCKLIGVAGRWAGTDRLDMAAILWGPLLANLGTLVIVGGYTMPIWGRRTVAWYRHHRSFRRLYPMWFALYRATPDIALFRPRSARPPWFVRDVETRLYRLIIEIRDGQRSLRPHLDEIAAQLAQRVARQACLRRTEPEATMEACVLALGIRIKGRGVLVRTPGQYQMCRPDPSLAAELVWLEQVADAFSAIERQERLSTLLDRLAA
ncbi:MAB_1171c family putative transporter [Streptomyces sp. NPDC048638]|uniref:MAB_1171c family putative transporter n=1 Tax=Streptomyces sp. NPDC048638 TaxID=3365580 RepID=UPI00371E8D3C